MYATYVFIMSINCRTKSVVVMRRKHKYNVTVININVNFISFLFFSITRLSCLTLAKPFEAATRSLNTFRLAGFTFNFVNFRWEPILLFCGFQKIPGLIKLRIT